MQQVPLELYPNQGVTTVLNTSVWDIALRYIDVSSVADPTMVITISKDGVKLLDGQRCISNAPVFWDPSINPADDSNFVWLTPGGVVPMWNKFDTTGNHVLLFVSGDELEQLRATGAVL